MRRSGWNYFYQSYLSEILKRFYAIIQDPSPKGPPTNILYQLKVNLNFALNRESTVFKVSSCMKLLVYCFRVWILFYFEK